MPGNANNTFIGTRCHFFDSGEVCHAGDVISISPDESMTATVRVIDGVSLGTPAFADHTDVVYDTDMTATDTWHYIGSCTNLSS